MCGFTWNVVFAVGHHAVVIRVDPLPCFPASLQGCPIGIPKNPEISGSSRKSSFGAAEKVDSARATYASLKSEGGGGGGVVAELSTNKSVDSSKNRFFV